MSQQEGNKKKKPSNKEKLIKGQPINQKCHSMIPISIVSTVVIASTDAVREFPFSPDPTPRSDISPK